MAVVHIPSYWREYTEGASAVEVSGSTVRAVLRNLSAQHPKLEYYLFDEDNEIREEVSVAINSVVTENNPLDPVPDDAEVYLVPAIAGGSAGTRAATYL